MLGRFTDTRLLCVPCVTQALQTDFLGLDDTDQPALFGDDRFGKSVGVVTGRLGCRYNRRARLGDGHRGLVAFFAASAIGDCGNAYGAGQQLAQMRLGGGGLQRDGCAGREG
jgi:hypothetical protein